MLNLCTSTPINHFVCVFFCLISCTAGTIFTCWFAGEPQLLSMPIYIPKLSVFFHHLPFSQLLTVEAATCVNVDTADIMTCWQKHKKMFRCGLEGNQQRSQHSPHPGFPAPYLRWWIYCAGSFCTGRRKNLAFPQNIIQLSSRKCTLQNAWAASATGNRQARSGH